MKAVKFQTSGIKFSKHRDLDSHYNVNVLFFCFIFSLFRVNFFKCCYRQAKAYGTAFPYHLHFLYTAEIFKAFTAAKALSIQVLALQWDLFQNDNYSKLYCQTDSSIYVMHYKLSLQWHDPMVGFRFTLIITL